MTCRHVLSIVFVALTACQAIVPESAGDDPNGTASTSTAVAPVVTAVPSDSPIEAPASTALEIVNQTVNADESASLPTDSVAAGEAEVTSRTISAASDDVAEIEATGATVAEAEAAKAPVTDPVSVENLISESNAAHHELIASLCREIGNKLGSVSVEDCLVQDLQFAGDVSVNKRALAFKDVLPPDNDRPLSRVMIIGGIHGDEYSSISIMFRWMEILQRQPDNLFHWRFLPSANPDGLLDGTAERQNANGVDLNRNFPSHDWAHAAHDTWRKTTGSNPRRFPGHAAGSEPETQWLVSQIKEFAPDVIVSVHAPYDLLDYDGPPEAPRQIGQLFLHQLGVYPGSLGNYGGINLGIPVVTLELPSAGIMPSRQNIQGMWDDLHRWLVSHPTTLSRADVELEDGTEQ